MTIKPIAPRIAFVVIELEDGRWTRFSRDDIHVVREFALTNSFTEDSEPRLWRLLEFMASLAPEPQTSPAVPVDESPESYEASGAGLRDRADSGGAQ